MNINYFVLIRDICVETKSREVSMADAIERCTTLGYTNDEIEEVIEQYEDTNMWQINQSRTKLIFFLYFLHLLSKDNNFHEY